MKKNAEKKKQQKEGKMRTPVFNFHLRTRDMAELFVCNYGSQVQDLERVIGSLAALGCGYVEGCETSWGN